jgi:hypothetical protein
VHGTAGELHPEIGGIAVGLEDGSAGGFDLLVEQRVEVDLLEPRVLLDLPGTPRPQSLGGLFGQQLLEEVLEFGRELWMGCGLPV